ncbi:hypothetical protein ADL26_19410, partial [Thermoactinomyces vulgaris]
LGDVVGDAGVRGGGGGQDRDAAGQIVDEGGDAPVVGAEVVAPVGDAVGLVDDEQAAPGGELRQLVVAEGGVVEAFGADEEHVDGVLGDGLGDRVPVLGVGRVDGAGAH